MENGFTYKHSVFSSNSTCKYCSNSGWLVGVSHPVTMGAMTLTILFDARIGFMATTSLAIFMGIMMGQNIDLVIVSLFTATIAVYNIRELRKRSQLLPLCLHLLGQVF